MTATAGTLRSVTQGIIRRAAGGIGIYLHPDFHSLATTWNFPAGSIRARVEVYRTEAAGSRKDLIMSTDANRLEHCLERRGAQRFEVHLPLAVQFEGRTVHGFTQDLSGRGIFFYAETALSEGAIVELTFTMPSEVTLAESMPVRCRGRVLRALAAQAGPTQAGQFQAGQRSGIAVQLDSYEYLPPDEPITHFVRVSAAGAAGVASGPVPR